MDQHQSSKSYLRHQTTSDWASYQPVYLYLAKWPAVDHYFSLHFPKSRLLARFYKTLPKSAQAWMDLHSKKIPQVQLLYISRNWYDALTGHRNHHQVMAGSKRSHSPVSSSGCSGPDVLAGCWLPSSLGWRLFGLSLLSF